MRVITRLEAAIQVLGLDGETALDGRWVMFPGERCRVFVAEAAWGRAYYTWCDDPRAQTVETYPDPIAAIEAGLQRAARRGTPEDARETPRADSDTRAGEGAATREGADGIAAVEAEPRRGGDD